jgi:predicted DNA-binding transcriptional regulator YafY
MWLFRDSIPPVFLLYSEVIQHLLRSKESGRARLKISESLLNNITHQRYAKLVGSRPMDAGWLDADLEFQTLESACEIILGFGSLASVLEPPELIDKVKAEAKAIVMLYT